MQDYSVSAAFQEIEEYLINSMIRNMSRHLTQEHREGLNYTQWQAEQLAALAEFRDDNRERFSDYFSTINGRLEEALRRAAETGEMSQETDILRAIKRGWRGHRSAGRDNLSASFFRLNDRKLNAYIAAVKRDMARAEHALLRMSEDIYRKTIFKAGVAFNTGAYTLPQAVDSATRDFLAQGINCIEYKNGARVNIDTYAEMAVRTSATRCYLMGEARKRDEWGINTVIVNKRGIACPKCLRYVGKVYYDDVYGNMPVPDDKYPRLSEAIAGGLYHPNCKDIHTTWFEGISAPPEDMTEEQKRKAEENYRLEQRQRYNERQIRKYKRLTAGTLDAEQREKYRNRLAQWEQYNREFVAEHGDVLRQRAEREKVRGLNITIPPPPFFSQRLREYSTPEGMLSVLRESAENDESAQLERYRAVLGTLAPDSLDKFLDMKYNKPDEWNQLVYNYRTVNRYEVIGDVPPEKILELDNAAWYTKQKGFDYSRYSGDERKRVKKMSTKGNAAVMEFDGKTYFAHSSASLPGEPEFDSYNGKYKLIGLKKDRKFTTRVLKDGIPREHDTEAKFLEYVADIKKPSDTFEVTILSEKHICESCQGVVEQFRNMYPNAKVNIISGKPGYNGDTAGKKTWTYRKKVN